MTGDDTSHQQVEFDSINSLQDIELRILGFQLSKF